MPRRHDNLQALPGGFEQGGIGRQGAPEIVDIIRVALGADIGKDGKGLRPCRFVGCERDRGHQTMAMTRAGPPVPALCLGAPTKIVAPLAGRESRLARFSMP